MFSLRNKRKFIFQLSSIPPLIWSSISILRQAKAVARNGCKVICGAPKIWQGYGMDKTRLGSPQKFRILGTLESL